MIKTMNIRNLLLLAILSACAFGCAGNRERRMGALRRDSSWPQIRTDAEREVARREGDTKWSHLASFSPNQHTNGVWVVVAGGEYPLNTMGDLIVIGIRDDGEIISYAPRHPTWHP